jgi:hypothetical protein
MVNSIGNVKMDRLVYLGRLLAIPQKLFTHPAVAGLLVFLSDLSCQNLQSEARRIHQEIRLIGLNMPQVSLSQTEWKVGAVGARGA